MSDPIVAELERRFLPVFRAEAARLQCEFPSVKIGAWSGSVGSKTSYQGYDVGIDCEFPDATDDQPNNVALCIGVMHLTTNPKICEAGLELLDSPIPYSLAELDRIEAQLPKLLNALETAIRSTFVG
jgi:hypothetical protein